MKCDCCGKFRKKEDCSLMEDICGDGFTTDQWVECIHCMNIFDLERHNHNKKYWEQRKKDEQTRKPRR